MKRLLIYAFLLALPVLAEAQCPDYSNTVPITWSADPGCYYRANGLPTRGRPTISGGTLRADNGSILRGTFMRVMPSNNSYWLNHALNDQTYQDMIQYRRYNCIRAFFYGTTGEVLDTTAAKAAIIALLNKTAQWGIYVLVNPQTSFIGSDSVKWNKWWDAMAPTIASYPNAIPCAVDEPVTDADGDGHYGTWNDWLSSEIAYEVSLYHRIRARAPLAPIILFENMLVEYKLDVKTPKQVIDAATGVNWSNAVVGFHAYPWFTGTQYGGHPVMWYYDQLKASYPVFMTSWGANEGTPPGGLHNYAPTADTMEAHGISWIELDAFPSYNPYVTLQVTITGSAKVYHVAPAGSDSNTGLSLAQAFRTITKLNTVIAATDSGYIHAGTYANQRIKPVNSGNAGAVIVYKAWPGDSVIISNSTNRAIEINGVNYVHVEGVTVTGTQGILLQSTNYSKVTQCAVYGGTATTGAIRLMGTTYCSVDHNYVDRGEYPNGNQPDDQHMGDGIQLWGDTYQNYRNLIRANTVHGCAHIAICLCYGYNWYNVVDSNLTTLNHTGISIQDGGSWNVVQANRSYHNSQLLFSSTIPGQTISGHALQVSGQKHFIARFNQLYEDTARGGIEYNSYQDVLGMGTTSWTGDGGADLLYLYIYSNTILARTQETAAKWPIRIDNTNGTARHFDYIKFINNIIGFRNSAATLLVLENDPTRSLPFGSYFNGNLVWPYDDSAGVANVIYSGSNIGSQPLYWLKANRPSYWGSANIAAAPIFHDSAARGDWANFTPALGSPVIDAGIPLTTTNGSYSSNQVTLTDAGFFTDGNGIVPGDSIKLGSNSPVGITSISGNVLTLNATVTGNSGDNAWLWPYKGQAPDMGALEYESITLPSAPDLLTPSDGTGGQTIPTTFTWSSSASATNYTIQISTDPDFTNVTAQTTTSSTGYTASLNPAQTYYWHVKALNTVGSSAYTATWSLQTQSINQVSKIMLRVR